MPIEDQESHRENWRDAVAKDGNDGPAPTPFEPPIAEEQASSEEEQASSSCLLRLRSLSVTEALQVADYVDFDHGYVTAEDNEPSDDAREDTKEEESDDDEEIDDS
jgi:hypothetical protein